VPVVLLLYRAVAW